MSVHSAIRIAIISLTLAAAGCASTIGNVSDLDHTTFTVGATHKNDIADTLGFPSSRVSDESFEYWGYRQKPELTGLVYALPTGANTVTTYTSTKIRNGPVMMDSAAVIYTFGADGILVDIFENEQD